MKFDIILLSTGSILLAMTSEVDMTSSINMNDETVLLDRTHRQSKGSALNLSDVHVKTRERKVNWSGMAYCPKHVEPRKGSKDTMDDVIPNISTCPWMLQLNYDPEREPSTLMTAVCTCTHCLDSNPGNRCVPVHYFRNVTYFPGTEREVTKLYRVVVGCTCQRYPKHSTQ
ncbi:uncharacterized protein [Littorina saxatilis]|uniref:uncharacterized protein n=1 Tax=Littorina saxatilis TaxID=31220 RepID=UPI0038B566BC